jgi:replicative DNA helicase
MSTLEMAPPHDFEAERSVVASLMVDPTALDVVLDLIDSADFLQEQNRWTFEACRAIWHRNEAVNQVTVAHELSRAGKLDECGGLPFLSRLVADLITPVGVEHYAAIIKRDATYRKLITAGSQIVSDAYKGGPDLEAVLSRAESLLQSVNGSANQAGMATIASAVTQFWEVGSMATADVQFSVRAGFPHMDGLVGGFQSGNLIIIAARPSKGKSALLLNLARNAAMAQNARVVICTLEMNRREWAVRLLSRESGIDSQHMRADVLTDEQQFVAMKATERLHGLNIMLADQTSQTVAQVRSMVRRGAAAMGGVDLVLVDYLQLMSGGGRFENRNAEVTEISRGLKKLAGDFNVPVIAAAQLSREVERRNPPIPMLSDLRDSGAIEQDADIVMFLHRPDKEPGIPGDIVKVIVAKNRNGPLGAIWMRMRPETSAFEELGMQEVE